MEHTIKVSILMATYNGENYLSQQLESIIGQSYESWTLFIRDDNSTDDTASIIKNYVDAYPGKIIQVNDSDVAKSADKNFMLLVKYVNEHYSNVFDYFMFCDQDDFWLPKKIEKTLSLAISSQTKDEPVLVHTDLRVVDQELNTISESFIKMRSLDAHETRLNKLLVQNNVTGCTMLWNEKLMNIVQTDIQDIAMHDWLFSLLACCFGKIVFLDEPTILYRQHGENVVGAKETNSLGYIIDKIKNPIKVKETLISACAQAQKIDREYQVDEGKSIVIKNFIEMFEKNKFARVNTAIKNGYLKQGFVQTIGELIFI